MPSESSPSPETPSLGGKSSEPEATPIAEHALPENGMSGGEMPGRVRNNLFRYHLVFWTAVAVLFAVDIVSKSWVFSYFDVPAGTPAATKAENLKQQQAIFRARVRYHRKRGAIQPGDSPDAILKIAAHGLPLIDGFFYLTPAKNFGAAWSSLAGRRWLLAGISAFVILLVGYVQLRGKVRAPAGGTPFSNLWLNVSLAFILGGALGNFYDRLRFGGVRDFLDFILFGYDYPIFNIADVWLVIGVVGYGMYTFLLAPNPKKQPRSSGACEPSESGAREEDRNVEIREEMNAK